MASSTVATEKLGGLDPQKISQFPYYLLVYYRTLVVANLAILSLTVSFLSKKNYVKAFLQEVKDMYFMSFPYKC